MTFPIDLPNLANLQLPRQLVMATADVCAFFALVAILIGFAYLLFGLQVFRLITTVQLALIGTLVGAVVGTFIDSIPVGMVLTGLAAGVVAWFYTRWFVALLVGLAAALAGWVLAVGLGANVVGAFFVAIAAAVVIGAPVLIFYRTLVMVYTSLSGAAMTVSGTAAAIVFIRFRELPAMWFTRGHWIVALVCILLLATPSFCFQHVRYGPNAEPDDGNDLPANGGIPRKVARAV